MPLTFLNSMFLAVLQTKMQWPLIHTHRHTDMDTPTHTLGNGSRFTSVTSERMSYFFSNLFLKH